MHPQLLIALAISFPISFGIAVWHIVTVNRSPQPPPNLKFGIMLSIIGVVMIIDCALFWSVFGALSLVLGLQGVAALASGAHKLLKHLRESEFQQH